jgi:hypothetical protein
MTLDPISGQYRDRDMRARANPQSTAQGMMRSAQQGLSPLPFGLGSGLGDEFNAAVGATEDAVTGDVGDGDVACHGDGSW